MDAEPNKEASSDSPDKTNDLVTESKVDTESTEKVDRDLLYKVFLDPDISFPELQFATRKLVFHMAEQKFGLKERDFNFYLMMQRDAATIRIEGGVRPVIVCCINPRHRQFVPALYRNLHKISEVRRGKSIDLRNRLQPGENIVDIIEDQLIANGELIPRGDIEVEYYRVIRVKHKITGVIITEEAVEKTRSFTMMIEDARRKLAKLVKVVGYHKEGRFNKTEARGISKLNKLGD